MMNIIEELKRALSLEIRISTIGLEYLEGVIDKRDLELLNSLLKKYIGPAVKESGKEANLPKEIQIIAEALGGLRNEQSFFYRQESNQVTFAAVWPWESDPDKMTLKCGVRKMVLSD